MSKSFFNFREERGAGEDGTPELVNKYKSETPGQSGTTEPKQKARKGDMLQNKDEPEKSLKVEEVEIAEGMDKEKFQSAEAELAKYARTSGGIDKRDFMDVAKMLGQLGRVSILDTGPILTKLNKKLQSMDTDPRDKVYSILKQKKLMEAVELDEAKFTDKQIKMAFGVANDKRYKGGNMTGAVRAIEKIAKGLSKHPSVQKVLRVTNEDYDVEAIIDALIEEEMRDLDEIEMQIESLNENTGEYDQNEMMLNQLNAIEHYIDGIEEYIEMCEDMPMGRCPEWYQNKLTQAFVMMQGLYSYAISQVDGDEEEMEESTKAYGDTMRKQARDRQQANMKPGEMDKLRKIRQMLDREKKNK